MPHPDTRGVHVWLVLMKAHQALAKQAQASLADSGLCFSDFAVLEVLLHKGPLPVNVLGAKVALASASATAAMDRLQAKRLVRRGSDPHDRRARIVELTVKGKKLIEELFLSHENAMEKAAAGISRAERIEFMKLLKKFGKAAGAAAENPFHSTQGETHVRKSNQNQ